MEEEKEKDEERRWRRKVEKGGGRGVSLGIIYSLEVEGTSLPGTPAGLAGSPSGAAQSWQEHRA